MEVEGKLEGLITTQLQGEEGFGYDPIFYVPHLGKTVAQLSSSEKNAISHRGEAVRRLIDRFFRQDQRDLQDKK